MITSISILRHRTTPFISLSFNSASLLRRGFLSISAASRHHQNSSNNISRKLQQQPNKNLLKARETVKQLSTLAPVLSSDDNLQLSQDQAIGLVAASQANFMRVIIQSLPSEASETNAASQSGASRSFDEVVGGNSNEFSQTEVSRNSDDGLDGTRSEFTLSDASRRSGEGLDGENAQPEPSTSPFKGFESRIMPRQASAMSSEGFNGQFTQSDSSRSSDKGFDGHFNQSEDSRSNGYGLHGQSMQSETSRRSGKGSEDAKMVGVELLCVVKAVLKKIKRRVLVGDKVLVGSINWVNRRGVIENVFKRNTEVLDPPVSNVDHLVVLFSMDQPKIEPFALTRFLVEAESTGIPFTLALNKSELADEKTLVEWKSRLRKWGYEPVFCSIESKYGLDTLQFILREQTSVIVGPSGVGKSSLINALRGNHHAPEDEIWFEPLLGSKWFEEQRVGEISMRSGRGKHTTRNVSLLPLTGGGYLADTPGFNQPSLIKVTKQFLPQCFPEIQKMLKDKEPEKCAFNNCLHIVEPGCLVKGDWERYSFYLQLLDEIRIREEFQLRTIGTKREGDVRYKVGEMGVVQAEPRLEPKKHRRQSRKKVNQSILDELDEFDDDDDEDLLDENPIIRAMKEEQQ